MLFETYLKEYHDFEDDNNVCLVSFEGDRDSIDSLRECAKEINGNKRVEPTEEIQAETVSHPAHYNREGALETIWEMVALYGIEETKSFCKLNAHKYRSRAMDKGGDEDMKKSDFYIKFYTYLKTTPEEVVRKRLVNEVNQLSN